MLTASDGISWPRKTKELHGALLDSTLLAGVYVELLGERQAALVFGGAGGTGVAMARVSRAIQRPEPLPALLSPEEEAAHLEFLKTLGGEPVWLEYLGGA